MSNIAANSALLSGNRAVKLDNGADYLLISRKKKESDPAQGSFLNVLFLDYDAFIRLAMDTADRIQGPFFFSRLREMLPSPAHPGQWGRLAAHMLKNGYARTNRHQRSNIDSRKGGLDWQYCKIKRGS